MAPACQRRRSTLHNFCREHVRQHASTEGGVSNLGRRSGRGHVHEHTYSPHPLGLLRMRSPKQPHSQRGYQLPPPIAIGRLLKGNDRYHAASKPSARSVGGYASAAPQPQMTAQGFTHGVRLPASTKVPQIADGRVTCRRPSASCQLRGHAPPQIGFLLNHLIGDSEHLWRNGEMKRPGGLAVDYELKSRRLQHGNILRMIAF